MPIDGTAGGAGGGAGGGGASDECAGIPARSLDDVYARHFAAVTPTNCVTAGCHGGASSTFKFTSPAELWQTSVGVPSLGSNLPRVTAGQPRTSYFYERLLSAAGVGRMPLGGPYLDEAAMRDVAGWICAGAPAPTGTGGGAGGGGGGAAPTIASLSPSAGNVGARVTITGSGFSPEPSLDAVAFGGAAAVLLSAAPTALEAFVPSGATTGKVTVTVGGRTAASAGDFTVTAGNAVPVITSLSPCGKVAGPGAFTLTVNGANFTAASSVQFNGSAVATTFVSAAQLTAAVPANALVTVPAGNVAPVVVTNPPPGGGPSIAFEFGVAGAVATLAGSVQPIFDASCQGVGCHGGAASAPNLTVGQSYASLVGAASDGCPGRLRVVPCVPTRAKSVLIDKILAGQGSMPCAGSPMPKGQPLSAVEKQRIVDWVAQGAPP